MVPWWCDFFRFSENSKQVVISLLSSRKVIFFYFCWTYKKPSTMFYLWLFCSLFWTAFITNLTDAFRAMTVVRRMQTLESPIKSCTWNLLPIPPSFLPLLVLMTGRAVDWVGGCSCSCRTFFANSWFFCCHRLREVGRVQNLNESSWTWFHHVYFLALNILPDSEHLSVGGSIYLLVQFLLKPRNYLAGCNFLMNRFRQFPIFRILPTSSDCPTQKPDHQIICCSASAATRRLHSSAVRFLAIYLSQDHSFYRVKHQVVPLVLLTWKQKLRFSIWSLY